MRLPGMVGTVKGREIIGLEVGLRISGVRARLEGGGWYRRTLGNGMGWGGVF